MDQVETIAGNKLIAEFMGVRITPIGLRRNVMQKSYFQNELSYHTSWDWLMPVVDKIRLNTERMVLVQDSNSVILRANNGKDVADFDIHINPAGIESVWVAIVEFIKWHNKNKA